MILRRWLPLLLCLLLLAGCASTESLPPPAENNPLSKAPPVKGAVTLYTYDGGRVNAQWITDSGKSAALVAALSAVNAPPDREVDVESGGAACLRGGVPRQGWPDDPWGLVQRLLDHRGGGRLPL